LRFSSNSDRDLTPESGGLWWRRRRRGRAISGTAAGGHADSQSVAHQQRTNFHAHLVQQQRHQLHRFGRLERSQGDLGQRGNDGAHGVRDIHYYVHGYRGIGFAVRVGHRVGASAVGDVDRVAGKRSDGSDLDADLVERQCQQLHSIGWMVRNPRDQRHRNYRGIERDDGVHVDVRWRRNICVAIGNRCRDVAASAIADVEGVALDCLSRRLCNLALGKREYHGVHGL